MSSVQELVINAGDTRATPLANCQTQTCKCGACTHCWVRGALVEASGTRGIFYFAAYSRCSDEKREELRGEMQASFGKVHPAVRRGVRRVSVCTYVCMYLMREANDVDDELVCGIRVTQEVECTTESISIFITEESVCHGGDITQSNVTL